MLDCLRGPIGAAMMISALVAGPVSLSTAAERPPTLEQIKQSYRRDTAIPFPADNPFSVAKMQLGKALFFDPRLSGSFLHSSSLPVIRIEAP
jgi:cytochrome c peroxidase